MRTQYDPRNVEPLYAVSTAHLPIELLKRLDDFAAEPGSIVVLQPIEYGALAWVPDMLDGGWAESITEQDDRHFVPVFEWAAKHGIRWIKFDCDAPEIDGLPRFDHDAEAV
jgi:hypothetical protein